MSPGSVGNRDQYNTEGKRNKDTGRDSASVDTVSSQRWHLRRYLKETKEQAMSDGKESPEQTAM